MLLEIVTPGKFMLHYLITYFLLFYRDYVSLQYLKCKQKTKQLLSTSNYYTIIAPMVPCQKILILFSLQSFACCLVVTCTNFSYQSYILKLPILRDQNIKLVISLKLLQFKWRSMTVDRFYDRQPYFNTTSYLGE